MKVSPMSHVLHRQLMKPTSVAVSGHGMWLRTSDGKEFLDATSGGAAVACLGHGNARGAAAIADQLSRLAFVHGSFFSTAPAEELADILLRGAPPGMDRVVVSAGGSESNEAALKLIRQTWLEEGKPSRSFIITRRQSYHGASVGGLSISGNAGRRKSYTPYLFDV